jgi:hypothetical protein
MAIAYHYKVITDDCAANIGRKCNFDRNGAPGNSRMSPIDSLIAINISAQLTSPISLLPLKRFASFWLSWDRIPIYAGQNLWGRQIGLNTYKETVLACCLAQSWAPWARYIEETDNFVRPQNMNSMKPDPQNAHPYAFALTSRYAISSDYRHKNMYGWL